MKKWMGLLLMTLTISASAERSNFDENWKFIQQDISGAEQERFDDSSWRVLDLPHDWSIEGEYVRDAPMGDRGGYLLAGISWYRKTVPVNPAWKNKHVEIAFDGVYMNSTVWANGRKLGHRPYGWISFSYDISDIVDSSDTITFAVRVDNEKQPSARWYSGSGIYAHTWIDVKDPVHVPESGIFIRTPKVSARQASGLMDVEVRNTSSKSQEIEVEIVVVDPQGKEVSKMNESLKVPSGNQEVSAFTFTIDSPLLWDLDSPQLYQARTTLSIAGKPVDTVNTRFGVRDIQWIPETGMWLNGRNVKLQGVCNHQDAGALGAAVPDKILRYRIEQLKAMGCNAFRTAHNPQTPIFYDICDELGMLVMDEIFDGWMRKADHDYGAHSFSEWWNRDLTDWIKRDRNHPSIVIYSVGNETRGEVGKELVERCHELDSTRPVTSGHSASEYMDVHGVNGGSEKVGWFDHLETDRVFIGTENTHTWQVRGFYRTLTWYRNGYPNKKQQPYETPDLTENEVFIHDWTYEEGRENAKQIFNSSYDNAMVRLTARRNIQQLRDIPNFAGTFRWTGHDYIGEAGYVHGGWPFKAFMGGAIDIANFEKDLFYLYQSQWTEEPMVHILPHWTHPKMDAGTEIPVWIYSNCDEVELFLNGTSLGKQQPGTDWDKMQCQWMVGWRRGTLKAVGYKQGIPTVEKVIRTANAPSNIALSVDGEPLADAGKDLVQVRVTARDNKGEFYPYGENRTWFHIIGPGKIRALDNGSPIDVEKHFEATNRIAFYGLTRAYIESTGLPGNIALLASCILGEKKQVTSNKVSIDTQLLSLRGKLPPSEVDVFYTLDGSTPTKNATHYAGTFQIPLNTTVKALVLLDGKPVQQLEERFAEDVGFVWNPAQQSSVPPGEQAENAKLEGATVSGTGIGFRGKGFVYFSKKKGSYIEWYQENDGDAGMADLTIRYSGIRKGNTGQEIQVTVSGTVIEKALVLPNTKKLTTDWNQVTIPIPLGRGANTIRLTSNGQGSLYIDEITIN